MRNPTEVAKNLRAILERETQGRVSISNFIGRYLRILSFPSDVTFALENGLVNLQEANLLARLSHKSLEVSQDKAQAIRSKIITSHSQNQGSQNSLSQQVKDILGEANVVSTETLTAALEKVDELLKVDPEDKRHLFYDQIKNLFYAMREIQPEEIDDRALVDFNKAADELSAIIYSIRQRYKQTGKRRQTFYT